MHIEFTIAWAWWQWLLALLSIGYVAVAIFMLIKGTSLKFAATWPFGFLGAVIGYLMGYRG